MRISIGSDHRGVELKARLIQLLGQLGHEVSDEGTHSAEPAVDYPDIATVVSHKVAGGKVERGFLVCGSGIGMAITANKVHGVRATVCPDEKTAELCRRHNNVNVLCLANEMIGNPRLESIIGIWLNTPFDGGRHATRVEKIAGVERAEEAGGCS